MFPYLLVFRLQANADVSILVLRTILPVPGCYFCTGYSPHDTHLSQPQPNTL